MYHEIRDRHFPAPLPGGGRVRAVSREVFGEVTAQLAGRIFPAQADLGLYDRPAADDAPSRVAARAVPAECFVLDDADGDPVGFSFGQVVDAETFFMVWSGILPDHQRRGLYTSLLDALILYLRDLGIERVTSNHLGTNRPVLMAKLKAGFVVTGMSLDERHGAIVWLTRFLDPDRDEGYHRAFSLDRFD